MTVTVSLVPVVLCLRYAREMMTGIVSTSSYIFPVRTRRDDNIRGCLGSCTMRVTSRMAGCTSTAILHSAIHEMKKPVLKKYSTRYYSLVMMRYVVEVSGCVLVVKLNTPP